MKKIICFVAVITLLQSISIEVLASNEHNCIGGTNGTAAFSTCAGDNCVSCEDDPGEEVSGTSALGSTTFGLDTIALGNYSFASGQGTIANGDHSTATGLNTLAEGNRSASFGTNSIARADSSFAAGDSNISFSKSSTTFGIKNSAIGEASLAIGSHSQAIGNSSLSFGVNTVANGDYSIAGGNGSIASVPYSIAVGLNSRATNPNAVALGQNNAAEGLGSIAFGTSVVASGNYSAAIGRLNNATGRTAIAFGDGTQASGQGSFASGRGTNASGTYSTAIGDRTQAIDDYAFASGNQSQARGRASTALGFGSRSYGQSAFSAGQNAWAVGDNSFAIGNTLRAGANNSGVIGSGNGGVRLTNEEENSLLIGFNAQPALFTSINNTGIGTISPSEKLEVAGNVKATKFIGDLNGNALTANSFTGGLNGDVTGTQLNTIISDSTVVNKTLVGLSPTNGDITSSDTLVSAIAKLDDKIATLESFTGGDFAKMISDSNISDTAIRLSTSTIARVHYGSIEHDSSIIDMNINNGSFTVTQAGNYLVIGRLVAAGGNNALVTECQIRKNYFDGTGDNTIHHPSVVAYTLDDSPTGHSINNTRINCEVTTLVELNAGDTLQMYGRAQHSGGTAYAGHGTTMIVAPYAGGIGLANSNFSGELNGDVIGPQNNTVIKDESVVNKTLVGLSPTNGEITSSDTILSAIAKLDSKIETNANFTGAAGYAKMSREVNGFDVSYPGTFSIGYGTARAVPYGSIVQNSSNIDLDLNNGSFTVSQAGSYLVIGKIASEVHTHLDYNGHESECQIRKNYVGISDGLDSLYHPSVVAFSKGGEGVTNDRPINLTRMACEVVSIVDLEAGDTIQMYGRTNVSSFLSRETEMIVAAYGGGAGAVSSGTFMPEDTIESPGLNGQVTLSDNTVFNGNLNLNGDITASNFIGGNFFGNGAGLTNIPAGPQGEQGPQGERGLQGIQGEQGAKGDNGTFMAGDIIEAATLNGNTVFDGLVTFTNNSSIQGNLDVNGSVTANEFIGDLNGNAKTANYALMAETFNGMILLSGEVRGDINNTMIDDNAVYDKSILGPYSPLAGEVGTGDKLINVIRKLDGNIAANTNLINNADLALSKLISPDGQIDPAVDVNNNGSVIIGDLAVLSMGEPKAKLTVAGSIRVPNGDVTLLSSDPAVNADEAPLRDSFRLRRENNFFNNNGKDAIIFEKTDSNELDPDGGTVFVNTGMDNIPELAMVITGKGNVGIGQEEPTELLEVNGNVKAHRFIGLVVNGTLDNSTINNTTINGDSNIIDGTITITENGNFNGNFDLNGDVTANNFFGGNFFGNGAGLTNIPAGPQGEKGDKGDQGDQGPAGPKGDNGSFMAGDVIDGDLIVNGSVIANEFIGNGSLLTNININNGGITNTTINNTLINGDSTVIDGTITITNNGSFSGDLIVNGTVFADNFVGDGSGLTGIVASNAENATMANIADQAINAVQATNALTANTALNALNFTGQLAGDVTGPQNNTNIDSNVVTSKLLLNNYSANAGTVTNGDSIYQAIQKLDGNIGDIAGNLSNGMINITNIDNSQIDNSTITNSLINGDTTVIDGTITITENGNFNGNFDLNGDVTANNFFGGNFFGNGAGLTNIPAGPQGEKGDQGDQGPAGPKGDNGTFMAGDVIDGDLIVNGSVIANEFIGNGSLLTNININNGGITNTTINNTLINGDSTVIDGTITITNNGSFSGDLVVNGTVFADNFVGDGSGLTGIVASNAENATMANIADQAINAVQATNALTANTALNALNFTGQLAGDVTGPQNNTNIDSNVVTSKLLLNNYSANAGTVTNGDSIYQAIQKLDGNIGNLADNISNGSINNTNIDNSQITNSSITNTTINGNTIVDGTLTFTNNGSIEGDLVVNGSVTATEFIGDGSQLTGIIADSFNGELAGDVTGPVNNTFIDDVVVVNKKLSLEYNPGSIEELITNQDTLFTAIEKLDGNIRENDEDIDQINTTLNVLNTTVAINTSAITNNSTAITNIQNELGNATPNNVPNTLVKRDADGSFAANVITANKFVGDGSMLTGIAINNINNGSVNNFNIDNGVINNTTITNTTIDGDTIIDGTITITENGSFTGDLDLNGDITADNFIGGNFFGNGAGLTNIPAGPQGEQGPQGEKGDQGDQGPVGPKGDNGTFMAGDVIDGDLIVNGSVIANEFIGNGSQLTNIDITNGDITNTTITNTTINNTVINGDTTIIDGTITITENGSFSGDLDLNGDITADNFIGGNFFGNGAGLTNIPAGPQGEQGPQGEKGDKGDQGDQGPVGPKGDNGTFLAGDTIEAPTLNGDVTITNNTTFNGDLDLNGNITADNFIGGNFFGNGAGLTNIPAGPQGEQGIQGEQGLQGPKGDNGDSFFEIVDNLAIDNASVLRAKDSVSGNDFLFGAQQLNGSSIESDKSRFFFDDSLSAFRAGEANGNHWDEAFRGKYSFAAGRNTIASATGSVALGDFAEARGLSTFAAGFRIRGNGNYSTVFGRDVTVDGRGSISAGQDNWITGNYSAAFGRNVQSFGNNAMTFGDDFINSVNNSFAVGFNSLTPSLMVNNQNTGIGLAEPTERLEVAGNVKAVKFIGDGSMLTNLPIPDLNGDVTIIDNTNFNGDIDLNGDIMADNFIGGNFFGNGAGLTNIPAGPQGEQGPQGEKGDKGDRGDQGPVGPKGDNGTFMAGDVIESPTFNGTITITNDTVINGDLNVNGTTISDIVRIPPTTNPPSNPVDGDLINFNDGNGKGLCLYIAPDDCWAPLGGTYDTCPATTCSGTITNPDPPVDPDPPAPATDVSFRLIDGTDVQPGGTLRYEVTVSNPADGTYLDNVVMVAGPASRLDAEANPAANDNIVGFFDRNELFTDPDFPYEDQECELLPLDNVSQGNFQPICHMGDIPPGVSITRVFSLDITWSGSQAGLEARICSNYAIQSLSSNSLSNFTRNRDLGSLTGLVGGSTAFTNTNGFISCPF